MLIPFPTFESHLIALIAAAEGLLEGQTETAIKALAEVHGRLIHGRGSKRHGELTEFVGQALAQCERREAVAALASLTSAFSRFVPECSAPAKYAAAAQKLA
jgi:hypothetical protein